MFQYERPVQIDPTVGKQSGLYWAADPDPKNLAYELKRRIEEFREHCDATGRTGLWRRALRTYYGLDPDGTWRNSHAVTFAGEQGQRVELRGNMYRAIVRASLVMTAGNRPSFACRAISYDAESTETVKIGNAILDKVLDDGVERAMIDVCEHASTLGEGWISACWDDSAGRNLGIDPQTGRQMHAGALRVRPHRPDEIVRDPNVLNPADHRWQILTVQRNRWELAALYPQYKDEILGAPSTPGLWIFERLGMSPKATKGADDTVITYEFYHKKNDAIPQGRAAILVGDCVIALGALPYEELPAHAMVVTREPTSPFGYADSWELLALQSAFDSVLTQIITTRENFGFQRFFVQSGMTFDARAMGEAFSIIEGAAPPVPLDFSEGGVGNGLQVMDMLRGLMQSILGMNDVAMGDASKSQSGAALAQMQQIASQFNSQNQFSYVSCFEAVMNSILEIMKTRASEEQIVQITGRNNVYSVRSFKAEDLSVLEGVKVEIGSAALRTLPMRHQIANELVGNPTQPITSEQFLEILATGRLEPVTSIPLTLEAMAERLIVEVQEGRPYKVQPTMPHHLLIPRLSEIIAQPGVDDQTATLAMQLIMQHGDTWLQVAQTPNGQTLMASLSIPPPAGLQLAMQQQAQAAQMQAAQAAAMGGGPMGPGAPNMGPPGPPMPGPAGNPEQMPTNSTPSAPMGPGAPNLPDLPPNAQPIPPVNA